MVRSHFIYALVSWWTLGCFFFFAIMNNAAGNSHGQIFVWTYVLISLGYVFQSGNTRSYGTSRASLVAQMIKNLPLIQETRVLSLDQKDSPGERNGYPLQYSCLENSMDGGVWWATVYGIAKSWTPLSALSQCTSVFNILSNYQLFFCRGYIILHFHQLCMELSISPNICFLSFLF